MGQIFQMFNAGNEHRVKQTQIESKRALQAASNESQAAQSALRLKSQSIQNQQIMKVAGKQIAAADSQIGSTMDAFTRGTFAARVNAAGQMGAATAGAAAAGVGGSTVDSYNRTLALNNALSEQASMDTLARSNHWALQNRNELLENAGNSMGFDTAFANMDHKQYLDHVKQGGQWGSVIATAVATYFGGPQAGMMAAQTTSEVSRAGYLNANGEYDAGSAMMGRAMNSGMQSYQQMSAYSQANNGQAWGSQFFQSGKSSTQGVNVYGIRMNN